MLIRLLRPEDPIGELTGLLHAAYAKLGAMGFNYTAVDQTDDVTRERASEGDCLIAINGDAMVGTILMRPPGRCGGSPRFEMSGVATIGQFAVRPGLQGRGVGGALLAEAERRAAKGGATELALDTAEGAHHLIAWYEKLGFRTVEHVRWSGKTYRSVVMAKPLEGGSRG